jgi:hypothetical protein
LKEKIGLLDFYKENPRLKAADLAKAMTVEVNVGDAENRTPASIQTITQWIEEKAKLRQQWAEHSGKGDSNVQRNRQSHNPGSRSP